MKNAILRNVKNWRGSGQGEAEGRSGPGRRRMGSEEAQMRDWEGLRRNGTEPPGRALGVWLAYERGQWRPGFEGSRWIWFTLWGPAFCLTPAISFGYRDLNGVGKLGKITEHALYFSLATMPPPPQ